MLPAAPQQQALLLALLVKATVLIHDKSGEALIAVANFENVSANATLSLADGREVDNKVLTARAVEGFQPMSTFSLDSPMSIGAKRGYMLRASLKGTGITKARQLTDDDAATTTVVTTQERRANQTGTARVINQTDVFVWAAMPKNLTHMGQQKLRPGVYGPKFPEGKTPALVFTGKTLIAFAQGKPIVVSRSTSFGKDWSSSRALVDDAENPAPVWVPASRRLLFLYKSITGHVYMLMESVDEGLSFSAPRRICEACMVGVVPLMKRWGFQLPGPPGGIVASTGRIVQCCDHMLSSKTTCGNPQTPGGGNADGSQCDKGNHILFSDDNGVHWNVSKPVAQGPPAFGDECSVAQLPGTNTLVLNTRVDSGNKQLTPFGYGRATAFSTGMGQVAACYLIELLTVSLPHSYSTRPLAEHCI